MNQYKSCLLLVLGILLFIALVSGVFNFIYDLKNKRQYESVKNSETVVIGDSYDTILKKMKAEPDIIFNRNSELVLFYQPPFGASEGIYFKLDKDSILIERELFEGSREN